MKDIRKIHIEIEELHLEAGRPVDPPLTTVIVAVVMRNPWAGAPYTDDLRTEIRRFAPELGALLAERLVRTFGSADAIQAYGKASMVGLDGELEHASAMVHTLFSVRRYAFASKDRVRLFSLTLERQRDPR